MRNCNVAVTANHNLLFNHGTNDIKILGHKSTVYEKYHGVGAELRSKRIKYECTVDQELAYAAAYRRRQTLRVYSPGGSTFLHEMTLLRHLEAVTSNRKSDSVNRCVLKNILAKFHPDPT